MGQGKLSEGSALTDDQLVQLVFDELMREPVFRAQARAAEAKGIDLLEKVKVGLTQSDEILREKAAQFFSKHTEFQQAPYAMFLVYKPDTQEHEVQVQVGNAAITAARQAAAMQLMSGELRMEIVDADEG